MTPIETLFCTPEQGRRLKELVPELEYNFALVFYDRWHVGNADEWPDYAPALTLQELRDVARQRNINGSYELRDFWEFAVAKMTAPELAAWVIERLEDTL